MDLSLMIERIDRAAKNLTARLPAMPWVTFMTWRDLFFSSWPVPFDAIRAKVDPRLQLDTFDGSAWVTMVAMHATDVHFRGLPPIPGMNSFRELNLRTYVNFNQKPGVFFLSIECAAAVVDWMSDHLFHYPYLRACAVGMSHDRCFRLATERTQADKPPAAFWGSFRPFGEAHPPAPGNLEHFLLERYSSFFVKDGAIHRADILHPEWLLQSAEANIELNTIPSAAGLDLPLKPFHTAFVERTDTFVWLPVRELSQAAPAEKSTS